MFVLYFNKRLVMALRLSSSFEAVGHGFTVSIETLVVYIYVQYM